MKKGMRLDIGFRYCTFYCESTDRYILQCVGAGSSADVEPMKSMHMVDGGRAEERFFFHGNHLSSVTWVSDVKGVAWQHLQYEPYGEGWVDERTDLAHNSGFSSRYRFTGKERDAESGLDYFGARYYWSGGGLWLSVDPLGDNYPFLSPYVFCANNPPKYIERDGLTWDLTELTESQREKWGKEMRRASSLSPLFAKMYQQLANSPNVYKVNIGQTKDEVPGQFNRSTKTLTFRDECDMLSSLVYIEEIFHAYQYENKAYYDNKAFNREFEARVAKFFIMNEMGSPIQSEEWVEPLLNFLFDCYPNGVTCEDVESLDFLENYFKLAEYFAKYSKEHQIGGENYSRETQQKPYGLIKLVCDE